MVISIACISKSCIYENGRNTHKIQIFDPDHPPSISTYLIQYSWANGRKSTILFRTWSFKNELCLIFTIELIYMQGVALRVGGSPCHHLHRDTKIIIFSTSNLRRRIFFNHLQKVPIMIEYPTIWLNMSFQFSQNLLFWEVWFNNTIHTRR